MSHKTDLQSNNTGLQAILDMILALGLVDAPKIITFTINGYGERQALEGMTWAEWVNSEYNVDGWRVSNKRILLDSSTCIADASNNYISDTDIILKNYTYYCRGAGNIGGGDD